VETPRKDLPVGDVCHGQAAKAAESPYNRHKFSKPDVAIPFENSLFTEMP
jgi:hypothetical protein